MPNNETGYDREVVPEFWQPLFKHEELLQIRRLFMKIYEFDRYTYDRQKRIQICDILETIIPSYFTKYRLGYKETAKTLINTNILNCFITLFYGIILYKLYQTKQDYLFIFKGGRALQLSLVGIPDIGQYYSEDTDILIIPNPIHGNNYNSDEMENLSEHIGYLIKWMIPDEINVFVSLPTNPKNINKDITKLLYKDNKLFRALSDIGFGEINKEIHEYFINLSYSPIYVKHFDTTILFITPTLDDMLSEKLFYYAKYFKLKKKLENNESIEDRKDSKLTIEDCEFLLSKFKRAIIKLVEAIIKKSGYKETLDYNEKYASKLILTGFIVNFRGYSYEEKEDILKSILT